MSNSEEIEHIGTICKIEGTKITVKTETSSACSSCHAKGVCGMSETSTNLIEVYDNSNVYSEGEHVNVLLKRTSGFKALFLGYLLPFIIFIVTLIISSILIKKEVIVGILAIIILLPYYLILFLNKSKIDKSFNFRIEKT